MRLYLTMRRSGGTHLDLSGPLHGFQCRTKQALTATPRMTSKSLPPLAANISRSCDVLHCEIGVQLDAVQAIRARYWVLDDESFTMQESLDITTSMETAREMSQPDAAAITGEGGLLGLGGQMTADMNNKCLFHKRLRENRPTFDIQGSGQISEVVVAPMPPTNHTRPEP